MSAIAEQLKPTLAALSPEDRREVMAYLAGLNGTTHAEDEWEEAWVAECERRSASLAAGQTVTIPHEESMAKLKARFG